jgi:hypothetical protein
MKNGQKEQLNFEKTPIENNLEKDILRTSINTFQKMKECLRRKWQNKK